MSSTGNTDNGLSNRDACTGREDALSHIPAHLQIKVLHADDSIIVIDKPCNLRSVPGHANPPPGDAVLRPNKRPKLSASQENNELPRRRTGQEAWVAALESFKEAPKESDDNDAWIQSCLFRLATKTKNLSAVPRKWKTFWRYLQRNRNRLVNSPETKPWDESTAKQMFGRIKERQEPLLNLPEPTKHEESAWGQLVLMGYFKEEIHTESSLESEQGLYVVHRLDCATSGVMVFAQTQDAASVLSRAWRERDKVSKIYLARVESWPPFQKEQRKQGIIDLPLAPSKERIKWEVRANGKPSTTKWRVLEGHDSDTILLELTPVTGRTHQLRIHCAEVGDGICGDSLYGKNPVEYNDTGDADATTLCLHAHRLSFPHPATGEEVEFVSQPPF